MSTNGFLSEAALEATTLGQDVSVMFVKTNVWNNYCSLPQPSGFDNIDRTVPRSAAKVWYSHRGNDANNGNRPIDYVALLDPMRKGEYTFF